MLILRCKLTYIVGFALLTSAASYLISNVNEYMTAGKGSCITTSKAFICALPAYCI